MDLICEYCGKPFKASHISRKHCSRDCYAKTRSALYVGENSPSWKGGKIKKSCLNCGKEIYVTPSRSARTKCCSKTCIDIYKSKISRIFLECKVCGKEFSVPKSQFERGDANCCSIKCRSVWQTQHDRGKKIFITCAVCGKKFRSFESRNGTRKVCTDPKCLAEIRSRNIKGEKCPWWKGGISFEPYCPKFNREFKERVRAFFNYTCIGCGKTQTTAGEKLSIHHVGYNKETCCDTSIPLFAPLCRRCHASTNNHREYWEPLLTEKILLEYDGKCYFTKEEYTTIKR
jgi:hypothetical protein